MLSAGELNKAIGTIEGVFYTGVLTRFVDSDAFEVGGKDCFYDLGPHEEGKRYTPKGGARGIYMAEGIKAALGEATQNGLVALNPDRVATRNQMDMEVKLKRSIDNRLKNDLNVPRMMHTDRI